jgi:uncharacterized membrane protein YkvA (DUF1232 family)
MLQDLLRAPAVQEMAARPEPTAVGPLATSLENGSRPWRVVRLFRALKAYVAWHLSYYKMIARDARTPRTPKILLWSAVLYAVSPIGLVPDIIPVVGYLDDVIIVPTLIMIAVKRVPPEVIIDCRLVMGIRKGLATASARQG